MLALGRLPQGSGPFLFLKRMKISATVITLNEENHLGRCLASLDGVVEETLVVDAGSRDRTSEIARELGARPIVHEWKSYANQKNHAAALAEHDWILSIDADECLSPELRQSILAMRKTVPAMSAFGFSRKAFYLGRWIHHCGWYPDIKTRLYLRTKAKWQGEFVHESLDVDGPIGRLAGDLLHYTCNSVSEHLIRLERYTTLAANDLWRRGKRSRMIDLPVSAVAAFAKTYWLKQGFRDGPQGLVISLFAGYYNFVKYAKLWELQQNARSQG